MTAGIDLAHRADFAIGAVEVHPATLEVVGQAGRERLEPRVMEVLLVLADADGVVVARDDLVAACWNGRVVGDDSISRVIGRIRRLTEGIAKGSFAVETIPKVGYRLVRADASIAPLARPKTRRPALFAGTVAIAAAALLYLIAGSAPPAPKTAGSAALAAAGDLELRGRAAVFENSDEQLERGLTYLREATAQHPGRASAWGALALAYAQAAPRWGAQPGRPDWQQHARQAAARALALDPRSGDALAALAKLEPMHRNWLRKDAMLRRALAVAPSHPDLLVQRARFLAHVGRTAEALAVTERVARQYPLVPWVQRGHMTLLAANGRLEEAERLADRSGQLWPDDHSLWLDRIMLHALQGAPAKAELVIRRRPEYVERSAGLLRVAAAMASGSAEQTNAIVGDLASWVATQSINPVIGIHAAAGLGRIEAAMAIAEMAYLAPDGPRLGEHNIAPLFAPPGDRLWSHPRFMPLMAGIDLVDYWRRTGAPDFCRSAAAREACARSGITDAAAAADQAAATVRP